MTVRRMAVLALAATSFALIAAACGGGDSGSAPTTTEPTTPTTTASPATTTEQAPPPTAVKTFTIVVAQGRPKGGIKTYTAKRGDRVAIVVRSDVGEGLHLHGYEIEKDVVAGKPTRIVFTASTPGRFEIELHEPETLIGNLQVEP